MNNKNLKAFLKAYLSKAGKVSDIDVNWLKPEFTPGFTSFKARPYCDEYGRHGVAVEAVYPVKEPKLYAPKVRVERLFFRPIDGLMMLCSPGHPTLG